MEIRLPVDESDHRSHLAALCRSFVKDPKAGGNDDPISRQPCAALGPGGSFVWRCADQHRAPAIDRDAIQSSALEVAHIRALRRPEWTDDILSRPQPDSRSHAVQP